MIPGGTVPLDLEKLLRIPMIDSDRDYAISPDGKHLAFAWNTDGQWEIYELALSGRHPAQKITTGPGAKFAPCYSPDGCFLAYAVDLDGSENFDIYLADLVKHLSINLTPDTTEAILPRVSWSPEGNQIALITNRSGQFDVCRMTVANGVSIPSLCAPSQAVDVAWAPDGKHLAVTALSHAQDHQIIIISCIGEKTIPITLQGKVINCCDARWSPDGGRLAFCSDQDGYFNIGIFEINSENITWITSGEGDKRQPAWAPDGQQLAYIHHHHGGTILETCSLAERKITSYQWEGGFHHLPRFTPDSRKIISIFESPERPPDLWSLTIKTGYLHQLTNSLPKDIRTGDFFNVSHIHYPGFDGNPIPALLYEPIEKSPMNPGVIVVHGGPDWSFQFIWYPLMAHMASRGWVVLAPNYRGSTDYGRAWQNANRFNLGRVDLEDVVAGAYFLQRENLVNPRRIAVTGRSHGGYLTMACLTQYPDQWIGGSAIVPFLNWFTSHANSRQDLQQWDIEMMGYPQSNYQLWHDRSPFFFLDRIQVPVQLICGANDPRCPASESLAARDILISLGTKVDFLLYPDEGHEFLKIENILDHELHRVAFLAALLDKP
jgi:dipeptidyl aminopeptidase/acylaminoacyl peptidase